MKYPNKKTAPTEDLVKLREAGLTLQEIADNYGVSRERIRQLIGNTGSYTKYVIKNVEFTRDTTTREAVLQGGGKCASLIKKILGKIHHRTFGDGYSSRGANAEILISDKLHDLGIKNTLMPNHHPFDILLDNGLRVDVKTSYTKRIMSDSQKSDFYSFNLKKIKKHDYCDFFIFFLPNTDEFFIVPNEVFGYVDVAYVSWPKPLKSWDKWEWNKYYNNFDLLR